MRKSIETIVNGIRTVITKSDISLDKVSVLEFQKEGTKTAQLRQTVTIDTFYPSKKVDSDMQQNLFAAADFGFGEQKYTATENRVAFLPVPVSMTEEKLRETLVAANANNACIYRVLATKPILDNNQKYAISVGNKTMDDFADSQVVRFPKTHERSEQLILDKAGNVNYRRTYFWNSEKADQDARDASDVYMSPSIKAELLGAGVLENQEL